MKVFKLTYLLPVLLFMALTACSKDSIFEEEGNPGGIESVEDVPVTFNLGTTRGTLMPAVNDNELITSYMIVVAQNGNIVKVITDSNLPAAEMHTVKSQLPSGTYKVYAFANIPFANPGDWLNGKFVEGQPVPDMSSLYYGNASYGNGYNGVIPMSNSFQGKDLVLSSKGNQSYSIEVVRMIAKVEFVFSNSSAQDIEISEIMMGPLSAAADNATQGYIPLSWYNDSQNLNTNFIKTTDYVHSTSVSLNSGSTGNGVDNVVRFNVIESNPDPVTNQFNLRFKVKYNGQEEYRWALLDKSLVTSTGTNLDGDYDRSPFIRRNDWIRIPIDLGDYEFRLQARSYPPIGGYPEANVDEFKVEFSYHGYFSIMPTIRKYGTTEWISLDNPIITRCEVSVDTEESKDLTDIFTDSGRPVRKLNEIVGTIKPGVHGTAIVTLEIDIKVSDSVTRTLKRQMYVTV